MTHALPGVAAIDDEGTPARSTRLPDRPALVYGLIILLVLVQRALIGYWPCDDAFISFRFAHNFAAHGSLVYNVGDPVFGCTTLLHALLLGAMNRIGIPILPASAAETLVADMAVCMLLALFCHLLYGRRWLGIVAAALWLSHPVTAFTAVSGMETSIFTALLLTMVLCCHFHRYGLALVVIALLVWTRIDGIVAVPVWIYSWWRSGRPRFRAASILALLLLAAAYVVFTQKTYGTIIPQSAVSKAQQQHATLRGGVSMVAFYVSSAAGILPVYHWLLAPHAILLVGLGRLVLFRLWRSRTELELVLLAGCHAAMFILPGRDTAANYQWYFVPALTLALVPALHQTIAMFCASDNQSGRRSPWLAPVAVVALISGIGAVIAVIGFHGQAGGRLGRHLPTVLTDSPERLERFVFAVQFDTAMCAVLLGLLTIWIAAPAGYRAGTRFRGLLAIAAVVLVATPAWLDHWFVVDKYARREQSYLNIGRWAEENTPPGDWVGASEIGAVGWAALDRNVFDELGLITRDALRQDRPIWVARLKPSVIVQTATSRRTYSPQPLPGYVRIDSDHNWVLLRADLKPKWDAGPPEMN